jgi:hypothetical protein
VCKADSPLVVGCSCSRVGRSLLDARHSLGCQEDDDCCRYALKIT